MQRHHVLLVPGFFGFGKFGELSYFNGVREALERSFEQLGLDVNITEVVTLPTASIRLRAARVVESLAAIAAADDGPIHIIGHSTGGLDARLAMAPTASLPTQVRFTEQQRVRTMVTVCCPHFGTPAATYFISAMGKPLLRMAARYFIWLLGRGLLLKFTLRMAQVLVRMRHPFARGRGTFDELYDKLLGNLSSERRIELVDFLENVSSDQSLLFQLTPAGCDLLNACTADPPVRYGSVVTRAPRPTWRHLLHSLRDVYSQLMYPVYAFLHHAASRAESKLIPAAVDGQREPLLRAYGELPCAEDNDGLVPTSSQLWGEVVHAACADHLDVVGQFERTDDNARGSGDWIPSYSRFDRAAFDALWGDVAAFIASDFRREPSGAEHNVGTARTEHDLAGDVAPSRP